jgi:bifunctional DNA-binding transcriptional regulator/antitoxin component of YhaV-PrlF toxin-antitoxin module|tara:strand:- start:9611 stop:9781 length:171 start_codon:yes stop_codon:yes gene_type:complete
MTNKIYLFFDNVKDMNGVKRITIPRKLAEVKDLKDGDLLEVSIKIIERGTKDESTR